MNNTQRILAELLANPITDIDLLQTRIQRASPKHLRARLLDLLQRSAVPADRYWHVFDLLVLLGTSELAAPLAAVVAAAERTDLERSLAAGVLASLGLDRGNQGKPPIAETEWTRIQAVALRSAMREGAQHPRSQAFLTSVLTAAIEPREGETGFEFLEQIRREVGAAAGRVYQPFLADADPDDELAQRVLELVVADPDPASTQALAELAAEEDERLGSGALREAWMASRSRRESRSAQTYEVQLEEAGMTALLGFFADDEETCTYAEVHFAGEEIHGVWMRPLCAPEWLAERLAELHEEMGGTAQEIPRAAAQARALQLSASAETDAERWVLAMFG